MGTGVPATPCNDEANGHEQNDNNDTGHGYHRPLGSERNYRASASFYGCVMETDEFGASGVRKGVPTLLAAVSYSRFQPSVAIRDRVAAHLDVDPAGLPSFSERFDPAEHQNLQLAFNMMSDERAWELIGLPGDVRNFGGFSLVTLVSGRFAGAINVSSPEYVNLPIAADQTLPCLLSGMHLAGMTTNRLSCSSRPPLNTAPVRLSVEVLAETADAA